MDHQILKTIFSLIRPGAEWAMTDGVVKWLDKTQTQPTDAELQTALANLSQLNYATLRAAAYPSIGDQLDALWQGGTAQSAMAAQIAAVKTKYPKPGDPVASSCST